MKNLKKFKNINEHKKYLLAMKELEREIEAWDDRLHLIRTVYVPFLLGLLFPIDEAKYGLIALVFVAFVLVHTVMTKFKQKRLKALHKMEVHMVIHLPNDD